MDPNLDNVSAIDVGGSFDYAAKWRAVGGSPILEIAHIMMSIEMDDPYLLSWMRPAIALHDRAGDRMIASDGNQ